MHPLPHLEALCLPDRIAGSSAPESPAVHSGDRPETDQPSEDLALALRYAPIIRLDRLDPLLPSFAGYTLFREDAPSASFPREVTLRPRFPQIEPDDAARIARLFPDGRLPRVPEITAALVVEYAIWWDWDIQHLYELEHAWSYVGSDGRLLYVEASWHGSYFPMLWNGSSPHDGDRPILYSQPGKHAFVPDPALLEAERERTRRSCTEAAGSGGLLLKEDLFAGKIVKDDRRDDLARAYMRGLAFDPSFEFTQVVPLEEAMLVPWPALYSWIPGRIDRILAELGGEERS